MSGQTHVYGTWLKYTLILKLPQNNGEQGKLHQTHYLLLFSFSNS